MFQSLKNSCIKSFLNLVIDLLWKFKEDWLKNEGEDTLLTK